MSQHYFSSVLNGSNVTVTLGWDRPLRHYFLTVITPSGSDDDDAKDTVVYSNLNERRAFSKTLDEYRAVLTQLGLVVPDSMFRETKSDQRFDVGNRCVWHDANGICEELSVYD